MLEENLCSNQTRLEVLYQKKTYSVTDEIKATYTFRAS